MSQADWAVARRLLALAHDHAMEAANIISAVPVTDHNKDEAERMERAGDEAARILEPWRDK